ncbi:DUF6350 family protein [Brachybacterium massiliense]|uniref:cell division protein PerM n=1 Tax=Brachybacterium massiliense TaxID=1755098 RepID=UPI001FE81B6A|nr:DUF6350 family protein [Brachybacterium massiliense]
MSSKVDSIATPLVRGVLGALSSLGIALAVVVVPALAAQVAGTASSATALDAILISLSVLILGHGGGIVLTTGVVDGAVTLTPFGLLILLMLLSALSMRRVGRALRPVRDDGVLRAGALRDVGSALGMYTLVYAIGLAVLASFGRSTDVSPVVTSAVVSGAMVALVGGLAGLLWSLRREPTQSVPGVRVLELLPTPYGDIARAALTAVIGLLWMGLAAITVMLLLSVPEQASLFDGLAPGIVGGLVLTLVQLALLPLLAVWALTVLLGGTVGVGTSTGISLGGAETGVLPALPILGALPGPGDFPEWTWALMVLPAVPVALGAVRLIRDLAEHERREQIIGWVGYPLAVVVVALLLAGLSTGGIGDGRLVHLGPQMNSLALPLIGVVALTTALVLGVLATPLIPWARSTVASLRERVEAAERGERREDGSAADEDEPETGQDDEIDGNDENDGADEIDGADENDGAHETEQADDVDSTEDASQVPEDSPTTADSEFRSVLSSALSGRTAAAQSARSAPSVRSAPSAASAASAPSAPSAPTPSAEEDDAEADAWSLDGIDAGDSSRRGSWISRRDR